MPVGRDPAAVAARRAARELRREKQRAQNVLRAAKMHAARLDYERSHAEPSSPPPAPQVNVGCSGWFYWHWREHLYRNVPTKDWFSTYAARFDTVELNAPFYGWPTVNTVKGWVAQLSADKPFLYTVKVSELITHTKRFAGCKTLVKDFSHIADLLGPRFGCFLYQCPPSHTYTPARLKAIVSTLDPRRRNVMEFRHKSWWNEAVFRAFRDNGIAFCSVSGPRLPGELVHTAEDLYVRFHGTKRWYRHDYTPEELAPWSRAIRGELRTGGAKRLWAYFNNDREGFALKNAAELKRQLSAGR